MSVGVQYADLSWRIAHVVHVDFTRSLYVDATPRSSDWFSGREETIVCSYSVPHVVYAHAPPSFLSRRWDQF